MFSMHGSPLCCLTPNETMSILIPHRITRLFCGNLNKKITEEEMKKCIQGITHIKWITDKTTGEFYGSTFLEMKDPDSAAMAVMQDKSKFMGR